MTLETGSTRRIGLLAVDVDEVVEDDFHRLASAVPGLELYTSRFSLGALDDASSVLARVADAAALLAPRAQLDAVVFACASGAAVLTHERVGEAVLNGRRAKMPVVTPVAAAARALDRISARSVNLVTPYPDRLNEAIGRLLEQEGYRVVQTTFIPSREYGAYSDVPPGVIAELVEAAMREAAADAAFIPCTALRVTPILAEIEGTVGRPVLAGNACMFWQVMHLAGVRGRGPDMGHLFRAKPA